MANPPRRIGLISDTHGLLRDEAIEALRASDLIVHAGDVGKPEIIDTLRTVAPVVAARGNVDLGSWASALPTTAVAETESALIYGVPERWLRAGLCECPLSSGVSGVP